jgi:hypothetical protein
MATRASPAVSMPDRRTADAHGRAEAAPLPPSAGAVLALQGSAGNAAVAAMISRRLDRCAGDKACGCCAEDTVHATSPPSGLTDAQLEEDVIELTVPATERTLQPSFFTDAFAWAGSLFAGAGAGAAAAKGGAAAGKSTKKPAATTKPCQCVEELKVKGSGAISGSYGIDDYWPGVTRYWGANKTLGKFDRSTGSGKWRMLGHKFQVVGRFSTKQSAKGGLATFQQQARLTTTKGGTAGAWFDDMNYTDAAGGDHHWDPNAEAGTTVKTGYPGVRRTIAKDKYAYTDPPAIGYEKGTTDTYRNLEFHIFFRSAPDCPCTNKELDVTTAQEIEVKKGKPKVLKAP